MIKGYQQVFLTDQGKYDPAKVDECCTELEAAGIDQIIWPDGLRGVYDDGRGNLMKLVE